MATRQEIGLSSFNAAQALYEQSHFRSSVRRSYYAAFSLLTHEPPPLLGGDLGGLSALHDGRADHAQHKTRYGKTIPTV